MVQKNEMSARALTMEEMEKYLLDFCLRLWRQG